MTLPLAQFLTRFSAPLPVEVDIFTVAEPPTPVVVLTQHELEARIAAARQEASAQAAALFAAEAADVAAAQEAAMEEALAAARATWSTAEGARLATFLETAIADIRILLSDRLVAVLRHWLTEAARARAGVDAGEALDRLLADGTAACLRISGPEDLVAAMRATRPNASVDWKINEAVDVTIVADATRIETQLAAALPSLTTER